MKYYLYNNIRKIDSNNNIYNNRKTKLNLILLYYQENEIKINN